MGGWSIPAPCQGPSVMGGVGGAVTGNGASTFLFGLSTARAEDVRRGASIVWVGVLFLVLVFCVRGGKFYSEGFVP